MFCAGDEFLNTQRGNNNPYNQDNETTWLDWSLLEKHRDIFRFFQRMISFRKSRRTIAPGRYWREDVRWHGADGPVDFGPESRCLAYCLTGERFDEGNLYVMINAFWQPVLFRVQEGNAGVWKRLIDTSRPTPDDISAERRDLDTATINSHAKHHRARSEPPMQHSKPTQYCSPTAGTNAQSLRGSTVSVLPHAWLFKPTLTVFERRLRSSVSGSTSWCLEHFGGRAQRPGSFARAANGLVLISAAR